MIGPTITLLQLENGLCIGGFTSENWESTEGFVYKDDNRAVVFNLTDRKAFPVKKYNTAIRCNKNNGPYFGLYFLMHSHGALNGKEKWGSVTSECD
jgi:hypothetical protein